MPAHSASAASSVKSSRPAACALRCAASRASKANACGVCTPRSAVRSSVRDDVAGGVDLLDRVGDRQRRDRGAARRRAAMARETSAGGGERPRRVVHQHDRGAMRAPAPRGRRAPRPAGSRRRRPAAGASGPWRPRRTGAPSSGWITGWTSAISAWPAKIARLWRSTGTPPRARYCLGRSPPARRPRPAATTTAATLSGHTLPAIEFPARI